MLLLKCIPQENDLTFCQYSLCTRRKHETYQILVDGFVERIPVKINIYLSSEDSKDNAGDTESYREWSERVVSREIRNHGRYRLWVLQKSTGARRGQMYAGCVRSRERTSELIELRMLDRGPFRALPFKFLCESQVGAEVDQPGISMWSVNEA